MGSAWSRREVFRVALLAGAAASVPSALTGCTALGLGNTLQKVKSDGVIKIGTAGEEPYSFIDAEGRLTGGIGELHQQIFAGIGEIEIDPVEVPFSRLLQGLDAGNFDVAAAGMFITAGRCDRAIFSDPVYCAPQALLVAASNPMDLSDYASIAEAGAEVAVLGGAVEGDYAASAGVSADRIRTVASPDDGLELVASGEVDALALTSLSLRALLEQTKQEQKESESAPPTGEQNPLDQVEVLDPFTPEVDGEPLLGCGAAAFRSGESELQSAFNTELTRLRESGELLAILKPWGFTEDEAPPPDVTTEQLCRTSGVGEDVQAPVPR